MTLYVANSCKKASAKMAAKSNGNMKYLNAKPPRKMMMMLKNIIVKY